MLYKKVLITLLLSFAAGYSFSQHLHKGVHKLSDSVVVTGKVITSNGHSPDNQVFLVDMKNPFTQFVKPDGNFSTRIKPADTMLFRAAGFEEKKVCLRDSLKPGQRRDTIVVKLDSLKDYFMWFAMDSNAIARYSKAMTAKIDTLYAIFSQMDTLHKFTAGTLTNAQKVEALKKTMDFYIVHPFMNRRLGFIPFFKMRPTGFYDFLGFLAFNYSDESQRHMWNGSNPKYLIKQTRLMYKIWKHSVPEKEEVALAYEQKHTIDMNKAGNVSNVPSKPDSPKPKGRGAGLLFPFYLIKGLLTPY
jgi:hypothetical protein